MKNAFFLSILFNWPQILQKMIWICNKFYKIVIQKTIKNMVTFIVNNVYDILVVSFRIKINLYFNQIYFLHNRCLYYTNAGILQLQHQFFIITIHFSNIFINAISLISFTPVSNLLILVFVIYFLGCVMKFLRLIN